MIRERGYGNPTNTTSGPSALVLKGELWIGVYGMKDRKRKKNLKNVIRDS